jgi:predicted TIM-barrel fold metal-dependent hydrolase
LVLDGHIHVWDGEVNREDFLRRLKISGVDGGVIMSQNPDSFRNSGDTVAFAKRLDTLFALVGDNPNLYPFYWIDPMEDTALEQVQLAIERGVMGFKVICNHFYPGDPKALQVFKAIAEKGKPILFHSGILWGGQVSSKYNKPAEFEALIEVKGLRFALAHISWPWVDEHIAVYGKFLNAKATRPDLDVEMFIDITPGTPPIYREDALTKVFTVGYDVENNVIFGTDCLANEYNVNWLKDWLKRDNNIYTKLSLSEEAVKKVYCDNLKRFVGIIKDKSTHSLPKMAE